MDEDTTSPAAETPAPAERPSQGTAREEFGWSWAEGASPLFNPTPEGQLTAAICCVMADVRYVLQTGRNDFHRYSYASDADLLRELQPAMARHGLSMVPKVVQSSTVEHSPDRKGKPQWRTDLVVEYTLSHVGGASRQVMAPGCGIDGEDKGAYKAMTGALKYALRHTFMVPTGDDAERSMPESNEAEIEARVAEAVKAQEAANEKALQRAAFEARVWAVKQSMALPQKGVTGKTILAEMSKALSFHHGMSYDTIKLFCTWWKRPKLSALDASARAEIYAEIEERGVDFVNKFCKSVGIEELAYALDSDE